MAVSRELESQTFRSNPLSKRFRSLTGLLTMLAGSRELESQTLRSNPLSKRFRSPDRLTAHLSFVNFVLQKPPWAHHEVYIFVGRHISLD